MLHGWKRIVVAVLTALLLFDASPIPAMASVLSNAPAENEQILSELGSITGSEDEAERYYELMERYGLLDEDGNPVESWTIQMDGKDVTLDEIREMLAGDYDAAKTVTVDGTPVTLGDLDTMLQIEDYVAHVKDTYLSDQEWTQEQLDALDSLEEQIANEGIEIQGTEGELTFPSGVDHSLRLKVEAADTSENGQDYTVTVSTVGDKTIQKDITFDYVALSGSAKATGSGTATIPAGQTMTDAPITVHVEGAAGRTNGNSAFVLSLYNVKNALFEDDATTWNKTVTVEQQFDKAYVKTETVRFDSFEGDGQGLVAFNNSEGATTHNLNYGNLEIYNLMTNNQYKSVSASLPDLSSALYPGQYEINLVMPSLSVAVDQQGLLFRDMVGSELYDMTGFFNPNDCAAILEQTFGNVVEDPFYYLRLREAFEKNPSGSRFSYAGGHMRILLQREDDGNVQSQEMWQGTVPELTTQEYDPDNPPSGGQLTVDGSIGGTESSKTSVVMEMQASRYNIYDEDETNGRRLTVQYSMLPSTVNVRADVTYREATEQTTARFTVPSGSFYPGQQVPISVDLGFPIEITDDMALSCENGKELVPVEIGSTSSVATYLYTVDSADGSSIVVNGGGETLGGRGANERDITVTLPDQTEINDSLSAAQLITPDKREALESISAVMNEPVDNPVVHVSVATNPNEKMTAWLVAELSDNQSADGQYGTAPSLTVAVDGGEPVALTAPLNLADGEPLVLSADVAIDRNITDSDVAHYIELYIDGSIAVGFGCTTIQEPVVFITDADLAPAITIQDADGEDYVFADDTHTIYAQDAPKIKASIGLAQGKDFSFGDTSNTTTFTKNDDGTFAFADPDADFAWRSTKPDVAAIDKDGNITPTGTGTASFELVALNGSVEAGGVPQMVTKTASYTFTSGGGEQQTLEALNFGAGLTPFLLIPNDELTAVDGQGVTVYWSSNLCDKNGDEPTGFTVKVKNEKGEAIEVPEGAEGVFNPMTVTGTASEPAASATIPAVLLKYSYDEGASNKFTVEVKASYQNEEYSGTATISLASRPAVVDLASLPSYYILDTQRSQQLSWTIEHFDRADDNLDDVFKFQLTKNDEEVDTEGVVLSRDGGTATGGYTIDLGDVQANPGDPTSYRDVYTVTVQAKNGTDSTWSYDSFVLYVYDADALQILVDGEKDEDGTLLMSNREVISKMSQADILALNRDISLKNAISINYGEYAWQELSDQIAWASSNSSVASVNYQQGTLYENIENFSYTSYRPAEDFVLSGLSDGEVSVTATHKLTGMQDLLDVKVETLTDKLYLFQCYPQVTTTLSFDIYTDAEHSATEHVTITSEGDGRAAYYAEHGIASDVYCTSTDDNGYTYLGTFYQAALKSGEQDSTKLELYPVNNLQMRRAAYAYVYLKNPDGTPYKGSITFRGGVYVNDEYVEGAQFKLNGAGDVSTPGNQGTTVELSGTNGKLEVTMDQTQWGLEEGAVTAGDKVEYVFQIEMDGGTDYLPMMLQINGTTNEHAVVGSGETVATFRQNEEQGEHPFIMYQIGMHGANGSPQDVLDYTGKIGPTDNFTEASLTTMVMWWGEEASADEATVALSTADNAVVSASSQHHRLSNTAYPFSDALITEYTVQLNQESLDGVIRSGAATSAKLNYYRDGETLVRSEELPFKLCNLIGVGRVEDQTVITDMLHDMGSFAGTNAENDGSMSGGDEFVGVLLNLVAVDDYTTGDDKLFSIQLAPTEDPTKFLGFIEANIGNMSDADQVTGVYGNTGSTEDFDYTPGISEMMMLSGMRTPQQYAFSQMDDYNKSMLHRGVRNLSFDIGGYAETLIYYNENTGKWSIQILNGGFNAGGGMSYTWNYNTMCGPIPFTASLTAGGTAEVSMDALTVSYLNATNFEYDFGNDFLTQLRIYLYLRFFAGVGFDYSIVAFKLGVFGQVDLDMQFQWLNRPYMDSADRIINAADTRANRDENGVEQDYNLDGQHFEITGQVGLEFIMKLLFISYEKVLFSYSFNLLDESTGDWGQIQTSWAANSAAQRKALDDLLGNGSATLSNVGGQQMVSLNLAPTVESRDYLSQGDRTWNGGGIQLFSLDEENGLEDLETNSYPYANPVVTDDGELLAYLTDQDSINAEDTRVAWATKSGNSYTKGGELPTPKGEDGGYGDSQLSLGGVSDGAVAAWTRQTVSVAKDEGATLTDEDQMIMMNGTDVYASVWDGSKWVTTRLSENDAPDMAPVVATNGKSGKDLRAVVAWRSVQSSGPEVNADGTTMANPTDFNLKDTIAYKVYSNGAWSNEAEVLYNGTSGAVKGIVAAMLEDGTAAVAYTLDKGAAPEGISTKSTGGDATADDREIAYCVIDAEGEVVRSVIATNDAYLDENPQIAAVTFPDAGEDGKGAERFVLGWYSEQGASSDGTQALDGGTGETQGDATSDIRLLDFDANGAATQLLPDSLGDVAADIDVSITSNFRFTKNAETINDLSILWAERAEGELGGTSGSEGASGDDGSESVASAERDVLKGVKFYTYGASNELVRTTGAIDVAEMGEGALIDHFDAYVSDADTNTVKAVILGTTYGEGGKTVTRTAETVAGDTVSFTVPQSESGMYTATESYADGIEVPGFVADYETVRLGATTQIQFTVENTGIHTIDQVDIKVGDKTTTYGDHEGSTSELNLLPGQSVQLAADYQVPENKVVDPAFTVTAHFSDEGASGEAGGSDEGVVGLVTRAFSGEAAYNEAKGTVYLDLPDVEVTDAAVVSEEKGKRTIQVKLNNHADASLANSGSGAKRSVHLGFYSDATCETPLAATYFSSGDIQGSGDTGYAVTVDDKSDLAMIDDGGYAVQVTFDAAQFAKDAKGKDASEVEEIPDTGIPVYIKVEVWESQDGGEAAELGEPTPSNNYGNVTAENLAVRTGEEVSINSAMAVDDAGTTVTVDLQNNRLAQKTTGNLIVTLLDADGKVIAQQQSYKQGTEEGEDNGLITLGGEGVETQTFTFEGVTNAAEVRVTYSDAVLDEDNAELASVSVDGVALTYDEATKTWTGSGDNLPQSLVTIVPENLDAAVTVNGQPYNGADLQSFSRGENRFEIVVTAPDGTTTGTYYLVIANNVPLPAPTGNPVTVAEGNGHGTVEVDPERAREGQTVTVTPVPDEGYAVGSVTVTTEDGTEVPVTEGEDGTWIFTMPAGSVTVEVGFHCLGGEACPTRPFGDVPVDAWYHDTMDWAVEEGLLTGYEDGTIGPDNTLSRSQLVTMLWRRAGSPETDAELTFTDCDPDAFYAEAVAWAASEGIVMGYGDGSSFGPEDPVTREQLAVIFWRQAGEPEASTDLSAFADGSSASAYAVPALKWAVETSLLFGFSDGTLAPGGALSRAQTAAMFMRQAEAESEGAEE